MVCDASIRGDRVSLMRAVGALEEVSARSADGGYSAARIATGVSKATVEAHARALAVTARDFAAAAEGQGAAAPLDAVSLAQLLDAERRTALAIDHLWRDSARIRRISIESRIARISERRRTMFAVWMSLLGLNALLAIALAQSIVRPQRALADAMNRLSHGDTASEPPFQSYRNEIGEMARAVGVFRQTLVERDALERDLQAERKVLERRVAERTQALEAANSAKTNFVASLSHEIRTPLNGVLGMAAALERTPLNAQQRDMVKILTASGDVLLRLLNNAIDISRIESGKAELDVAPFDLKELMDFAVSLYRAQAEAKGLWLDLAIAPDAAGAYRGDAVRIRQVVQNFVSNAVKFTERGGVSVSVAKIARQDGRFALRFEVNDTGIGLPAKPERLFQTFTQGDRTVARRFGGAGLGLAICKEIAALMGGELSARPRAGGGSTFRFDAPLERIARMADEVPPPVQTLRGLRTLVVDDNPMNRLVLQALLRQFGVEPEMAHGGREALEAADAGPYDLILLDVRMPDLDGLAVARAIRARPGPNRTTPIIALSGESAREEIERHIAAGMNGHVSKPIQVEALLAAIGAAVAAEGERRRAQSRLV
jgi:signal transduction histidine kinase/AmiR/NasT family two-component response regulator